MSIPHDDEIKLALLCLLSKAPDGTMHCQEVYLRLARQFPEVTEDEVKVPYRNSVSKWANSVQWAREHCKQDGDILAPEDGPGAGYWRITDQGRAAVEERGDSEST